MPVQTSLRALILLCGLTAGCAQTANVRCWQPAEIADADLQCLAVVGADDDVDRQAALGLERRLQQESSFEVVAHPDEVSRVVPAGYPTDEGPGLDRLLQAGREADLDAVVVVNVEQADVGPSRRSPWSWNALWGPPESSRTASVRVQFKLIDTTTSEVLAEREIHRAAPQPDESGRGDDALLDSLLSECVDEFVAVLEPHETESSIQLAEGAWYSLSGSAVRRGVRFARQGRWQQAEAAWKRALKHNARNDAALFNLAVASAESGDFTAAEEYAMEALHIQHTDCYATGLEQIRALRSASEEAEQQMRTAIVPAGFMDDSRMMLE